MKLEISQLFIFDK